VTITAAEAKEIKAGLPNDTRQEQHLSGDKVRAVTDLTRSKPRGQAEHGGNYGTAGAGGSDSRISDLTTVSARLGKTSNQEAVACLVRRESRWNSLPESASEGGNPRTEAREAGGCCSGKKSPTSRLLQNADVLN